MTVAEAEAEAETETLERYVHILIVDDDALFVESLGRNLVSSGYRVTTFGEGEQALAFLEGSDVEVDLVLLDWKMPGMNGIEVLRRLRATWPDLPVIFLTVLGEQIYEEAALIGGAVDYVEKSRSYSILRKRIDLVFEHRQDGLADAGTAPRDGALAVGPLTLDLDSSRAYWHGRIAELTLTEFRLVHCLASQSGRDISYRELYNLVHREGFLAGYGEDGYRTNVRSFIKRIRQKFRDIDPRFDRIENYPAFGYRWRSESTDEA